MLASVWVPGVRGVGPVWSTDSDTMVVIYSIMARVLCLLVCVRLLIRVLWGGHSLVLFDLLYNG